MDQQQQQLLLLLRELESVEAERTNLQALEKKLVEALESTRANLTNLSFKQMEVSDRFGTLSRQVPIVECLDKSTDTEGLDGNNNWAEEVERMEGESHPIQNQGGTTGAIPKTRTVDNINRPFRSMDIRDKVPVSPKPRNWVSPVLKAKRTRLETAMATFREHVALRESEAVVTSGMKALSLLADIPKRNKFPDEVVAWQEKHRLLTVEVGNSNLVLGRTHKARRLLESLPQADSSWNHSLAVRVGLLMVHR